MTDDEIIERAIQGHGNTRDAIRWALLAEREACAKVCDDKERANLYGVKECAAAIRERMK